MEAISVFMLSRDSTIVDPESATYKRIREYEKAGATITSVFVHPKNVLKVLWKGIRTVKKDWVVTSQDPFECGFVAWLIARLTGAKLEIQMHGDFFNPLWAAEHWNRKWRLKIAKFTLKRAHGWRTPSYRVAASLLRKLGRKNAHSNGVWSLFGRTWSGSNDREKLLVLPTPTSRRINPLPVSDKVILYAGRFSKEKNLPLLIQAFQLLAHAHPTAQLHLVGGDPQELPHYLPDRVFVRPFDDEAKLSASVCVLPSNHESWSRFVVEAALSGVPVVMTDVGCAGEVIIQGKSGFVVPVGDVKLLAMAITEMLDANPGISGTPIAERMAGKAKEIAEKLPAEKETGEIMVANWRSLYAEKT